MHERRGWVQCCGTTALVQLCDAASSMQNPHMHKKCKGTTIYTDNSDSCETPTYMYHCPLHASAVAHRHTTRLTSHTFYPLQLDFVTCYKQAIKHTSI